MPEVFFLLACYGLTFLTCDATIFNRPRDYVRSKSRFLSELLTCYFCTGFWVSSFWYVVLFYPSPDGDVLRELWFGLGHAFAGASFSYALNVALLRLEKGQDSSA